MPKRPKSKAQGPKSAKPAADKRRGAEGAETAEPYRQDACATIHSDELRALTGLDDGALRRLAGKGVIPRGKLSQYPRSETIRRLFTHFSTMARGAAMDHPVYADMGEAEARGLLPREFQKFAKARGIQFINLNRSIKSEPLRQFAAEVLRRVLAVGGVETILDGEEVLNPDAELARLRREQRIGIQRENAEAAEVLHNKSRVEDVLWNHGAGPLRSGLLNLRKTAFAQVDAELEKAELPKKVRETVGGILRGAVDQLLVKIRQGFPKREEVQGPKPKVQSREGRE